MEVKFLDFLKIKIVAWIITREFKKAIKKEGNSMIKEGKNTSEHFLSWFAICVTVFCGLSGYIPLDLMAKIIAFIAMVYAIARAIVKFTPSKVDDAVIDKIEKILKDKALLK